MRLVHAGEGLSIPGVEALFTRLLAHYGAQHWWPAEHPFEMMIGAILTQNTNWRQVEKAIEHLREADCLDAESILRCSEEILQQWIRPAGFFRQKARRLRALARFYQQQGGARAMRARPLADLRRELLALHGVGPETADSILLYALDKPVFVIDAYTWRIARRLGWVAERERDYHRLQAFFQSRLPEDVPLWQEYHALLVQHAKSHCRKAPRCLSCPLREDCQHCYAHA